MTILEGLMKLYNITKKDLAAQLGVTTRTLNRRLKDTSEWKLRDINNIVDIFSLESYQFKYIFKSKVAINGKELDKWIKKMECFINRNATTKYCNKM
ncbi:helix-turn-helix domain-containing protein [Sebaldella sp. S0638]|uniref:helix-turn-helix domain-containing protein n=1 Tax=Sebaldella sp. S0638 TaxID=2957809 RepID=UPI0020A106E7|nr:helix-turn-helix domain-containing protein [Sebaldella sp. S0638]MCP1223892.1 hypothetical protein [Sebaldella sp. S0638]